MKTLIITLTILTGALVVQAQDNKTAIINAGKYLPQTYLQATSQAMVVDGKVVPDKHNNSKLDTGEKITYTPSTFIVGENMTIDAIKALLERTNMPIVKLPNTDTNMPIIKTDRTKHNMPVVGGNGQTGDDKKKTDLPVAPKKP